MENFVIALDGHSSTGKSTLAKRLAKTLGVVHIDTGAMYRAVACYALSNHLTQSGIPVKSELVKHLPDIHVDFEFNPKTNTNEVLLNGLNIEQEIRQPEVSAIVSEVAAIPEVREKLVKLQQEMGRTKSLVMDGRDIGSNVFPEADVKLFLTSRAEVRANRRFKELTDLGKSVEYSDVLENVMHRDEMDSNRATNPLIKTEDAVEIDNSDLTKEETFERSLEIIQSKIRT